MKNDNIAKKVGIMGAFSNLLLFVIKIFVGISFKSQGLIADAINSFGDVFSSIVTYVGGKISSKPADEDHEFGHEKAEFVASFLIGIFMIIVSSKTLYNSLKSIIYKEVFTWSYLLVIVTVTTIIIKLLLLGYVKRVSRQKETFLVIANSNDHRNDILLSFGVLIGIIFGYYGYTFVDGIVGAIISIIIAITGVKITHGAYEILIDKCINVEIVNTIKQEIENIQGVRHVDSIKSKPTGNLHMLIVKISVDPDMTVKDSHKIAGMIRNKLKNKNNIYDVVVHINPD